jgi:hypothetical protein
MHMDWMSLGQTLFMTLYTIMLIVVSIYGFHRYALVFLYYRHRNKTPKLKGRFEQLPPVTIQLPMYNEKHVARRVIERTCQIDYPGEKLQIQVLDDSTDETSDIARRAADEMRARGYDIEYIHRDNREGYKAGALANGLKSATGQFITIFDADFVPEPWFLKRSIHYFTDPKTCVVQTRWVHMNRDDSLLTRSQAIFLMGTSPSSTSPATAASDSWPLTARPGRGAGRRSTMPAAGDTTPSPRTWTCRTAPSFAAGSSCSCPNWAARRSFLPRCTPSRHSSSGGPRAGRRTP